MLTKLELQTLAQWDKVVAQSANPMGLTDEMIAKMPEALQVEGATYLGRYKIPRVFVQYVYGDQPRQKHNDQQNISDLMISFEEYGIDTTCHPPIVQLINDGTNPFLVKGVSGFHRDDVFESNDQEFYVYDLYDFDSPWSLRLARSVTNAHRRPAKKMTRYDYLKEIKGALKNNEIEPDADSISQAVDRLAIGAGDKLRRWVKIEAANCTQDMSNFRTYNPEGKIGKSTIHIFCKDEGIPFAGTVGRTKELIEEQGCVTYFATNANNFSTWGRGFANSQEYDVPIIFFAYLANPVKDLRSARQELLDEFVRVKDLFVSACFRVTDAQPTGESHYFPIKFGGFLPQYIKSTSSLGGLPTESTIVDVDGNVIEFSPDMPCLTER